MQSKTSLLTILRIGINYLILKLCMVCMLSDKSDAWNSSMQDMPKTVVNLTWRIIRFIYEIQPIFISRKSISAQALCNLSWYEIICSHPLWNKDPGKEMAAFCTKMSYLSLSVWGKDQWWVCETGSKWSSALYTKKHRKRACKLSCLFPWQVVLCTIYQRILLQQWDLDWV